MSLVMLHKREIEMGIISLSAEQRLCQFYLDTFNSNANNEPKIT